MADCLSRDWGWFHDVVEKPGDVAPIGRPVRNQSTVPTYATRIFTTEETAATNAKAIRLFRKCDIRMDIITGPGQESLMLKHIVAPTE